MSDQERRRPRYGEYATPEEQRAAIKAPLSHNEGVPLSREPRRAAVPSASGPAAPRPLATPGSKPQPAAQARTLDRMVSIMLLAFGLINVLSVLPGFLGLGSVLNSAFQQYGLGHYTPTTLTSVIGIVLVAVYGGGWIATAAATVLSLRAGRTSFWIPLAAGVVAGIIAMVCFVILFVNDPAFVQYVSSHG